MSSSSSLKLAVYKMKRALFIPIVLLPLLLCGQSSERTYPLGSPALTDTAFAAWEASVLSENAKHPILFDIVAYYSADSILFGARKEPTSSLPPVKEYQVIGTNSMSMKYKKDFMAHDFHFIQAESVKDYNYRLPDLGGLQVYFYGEAGSEKCSIENETEELTCNMHGLLLFYHPGNQTLDILPALDVHTEGGMRWFRTFHIDSERVRIFEGLMDHHRNSSGEIDHSHFELYDAGVWEPAEGGLQSVDGG